MNKRKIYPHKNESKIYIDFYDFESRDSLPNFLESFQKATDLSVISNIEAPYADLFYTNSKHIMLYWDDMCGCGITSQIINAEEIVKLTIIFLASNYIQYSTLRNKILKYIDLKEINESEVEVEINKTNKKFNKTFDCKDVINDVKSLIEILA